MGISPPSLAPRGLLSPATPVESVVPLYTFGIGWVLRQRLKWARDALPGDRFANVLEVGYGSGIFMHELAKHASQLYGSDVHGQGADVRRRLRRDGVIPYFVRSKGDALPFCEAAFDAVVIVSALELVADPARVLREAVRVVRPGGAVVCVAPRVLRWATRLASVLLGSDADREVQDGRVRIQAALDDRSLRAERSLRPRLAPRFLAPYEVVVLRRLPIHATSAQGVASRVPHAATLPQYQESR
jgi:SAM-dependent methyltransferase